MQSMFRRPQTSLGNALSHPIDLIRSVIESDNVFRFYIGVQLNARPHLGSILTIANTFALAAATRERFSKSCEICFTGLDNAESIHYIESGTGVHFRQILSWTMGATGVRELLDSYYGFALQSFGQIFEIPYYIEIFSEQRARPEFLRNLLAAAFKWDSISALINPVSRRLPLRPLCPQCGILDIRSETVRFHARTAEAAEIEFRCPFHGEQLVYLREDFPIEIDCNSIFRNLVKEMVLGEARNSVPVIVKGNDWCIAAAAVTRALDVLGVPVEGQPIRLFSPIVVGPDGCKLSKSTIPGQEVKIQIDVEREMRMYTSVCAAASRVIASDPLLFFRSFREDDLIEKFSA